MNVLLRDTAFTEELLARELIVHPQTIAAYRAGMELMPLDRQLCLALLMMTLPAKYARHGFLLRDQVRAAIQFEERFGSVQQISRRL